MPMTIKEIFDLPEVQGASYDEKVSIMRAKLKQNNADPELADDILQGMGYAPKPFPATPPPDTALQQGRPVREAASRVYTPLLEGLGMTAGLPAFAMSPYHGVGATAAGYGIGEETAKNIDTAIGLPVERPRTIPEAGLHAAELMKKGAQFELGGRLGGKVLMGVPAAINRVGRYFASDTPAFTQEAERIALEAGFRPTAAERTASSALAKVEKVLRWFPTSGGEFTRRDAQEALKWVRWRDALIEGTGGRPAPGAEGVDRAVNAGMRLKSIVDKYVNETTIADEAMLNEARDAFLKALGSRESYTALGKSAQEMIKYRNALAAQKAEALYDAASEHLTPGDKVIPTNMMQTAEEILREQNALPPASRDMSLIKRLQEFAKGGLPETSIEGMEGYTVKDGKVVKAGFEEGYTWNAVKLLKGHFRNQIESGDVAVKRNIGGMKFMSSPEAGVYKRLQGALGKDIKEFAKQKGGDFERTINTADRFYKGWVTFYQDPDVVRMMTEKPEYLLRMVARPGGTTIPDKFRKAAGPKMYQRFKTRLAHFIFGMDKPSAPFNPDTVANTLDRYGESLPAFFSPREIEQMYEVANVGKGIIARGLETNKFFIDLLKRDSARIIGGQHLGEASQPIVGYIVRHDNIPMLRRLLPILGKETMNDLRATWLANVIDKNRFHLIQPAQLTKLVKTFGKDALDAFLGEDITGNILRMEKVATVQKTVEELAKNPSGTAQGLMTYFTALRTAGQLSKGSLWGVIRELWPPNLLAKLYLSETGTKLLTGTWQLSANSEAAARAHAIMWALVTENERDVGLLKPQSEEGR